MKNNNDIIFWTDVKSLPEIEPISLGQNFIPEWFQNIPKHFPEELKKIDKGSIKNCPGFIEFFKVGYVMPLWCDLNLNVVKDGESSWESPDKRFIFDTHPNYQFLDHVPESIGKTIKLVVKTLCPWHVKTPKGISMLWLPMLYHYDPNFSALPGIIPTDRVYELNPQMLIYKEGKTTISRGTPLGMFVPIRQEKFNLIVREATEEDSLLYSRYYYAILSKFTNRLRGLQKKK